MTGMSGQEADTYPVSAMLSKDDRRKLAALLTNTETLDLDTTDLARAAGLPLREVIEYREEWDAAMIYAQQVFNAGRLSVYRG